MSSEITLSPFYHSAVNAVTKPNKFTATSNYFVERWMPLLGGNGTMIVLALRRDGFVNHKTGERRDEIAIDGAGLAAAAGISEDTLIRELGENKKTGKPQNEWLHYFVQKRPRKRRNKAGQLRQQENAYWVAMDDPVHPDDWPLVVQAVKGAEERTQKQPGSPDTHFAYPVEEPDTHFAVTKPQSAGNQPHFAVTKPQSAYHLKSLDSSLLQMTSPDTPGGVPEFSLTLFPDKNVPEPEWTTVPHWKLLPETEQQPWLEQARRELVAIHTGSGITPKPKLVEVRAKNLYEVSLKKLQEVVAEKAAGSVAGG